jgi:hypothetical protein
MDSVTSFIEGKLKLKVNLKKSAVDRPWKRKFLGFSFTNGKEPKVRIAKESMKRMQNKIREITSRKKPYPGGLSNRETKSVFNGLVWIFCIGRYTKCIQEV